MADLTVGRIEQLTHTTPRLDQWEVDLQQKSADGPNSATTFVIEPKSSPGNGLDTKPTKSVSYRGTRYADALQRVKQAPSSDTPCGPGKSSSQSTAHDVERLACSTATITTIQSLLTLSGSVEPVTVRLTESDRRLIASAPELLDLLQRIHERLTDGRDIPEWMSGWAEEVEAAIAKVEEGR
jgi:hypothetical protein